MEQKTETKTNRNSSVDVARYVAAIMVLTCHAHIGRDFQIDFYYFFSQYLPRVSVAFFLSISGYYYISGLLAGKKLFKKQIITLLKVYGVWSIVYCALSFVMLVVIEKRDLSVYLWQRVYYFFFEGTYAHFWYFPALIYSIVIITFAYKVAGRTGLFIVAVLGIVLNMLGALSGVYNEIGLKIPILSTIIQSKQIFSIRGIFMIGLPSVSLGYWICEMKEKVLKWSELKFTIISMSIFLIYLAEIILCVFVLRKHQNYEAMLTTYFLGGVCILFLLRHPMQQLEGIATDCRKLSGFMYYVHPLIILGLEMIARALHFTLPTLVMFFLVVAIATVSGLICIKSKIKILKYFI